LPKPHLQPCSLASASPHFWQLCYLYEAQASGLFFRGRPQVYFGATPISYAACFGMKHLIQKMLLSGWKPDPTVPGFQHQPLVGLDSYEPFTGFSPLHAVIAIGLDDMVEFLLDLPEGDKSLDGDVLLPWPAGSRQVLRARLDLKTPALNGEVVADPSIPRGLTALQLATFLWHKAVVTRILKRHMQRLWKWGPQSENHLFLDEIDSAEDGSTQVMGRLWLAAAPCLCLGLASASPSSHPHK
jgi:hypothetical protein